MDISDRLFSFENLLVDVMVAATLVRAWMVYPNRFVVTFSRFCHALASVATEMIQEMPVTYTERRVRTSEWLEATKPFRKPAAFVPITNLSRLALVDL